MRDKATVPFEKVLEMSLSEMIGFKGHSYLDRRFRWEGDNAERVVPSRVVHFFRSSPTPLLTKAVV
jgi:hypothetical protein